MVPFFWKKTSLKIFHWDKTLQATIQTAALSEQSEKCFLQRETLEGLIWKKTKNKPWINTSEWTYQLAPEDLFSPVLKIPGRKGEETDFSPGMIPPKKLYCPFV